MEQEFLKCLLVTILDWDYDIFQDASVLKHEFPQKPKVRQGESQSLQ